MLCDAVHLRLNGGDDAPLRKLNNYIGDQILQGNLPNRKKNTSSWTLTCGFPPCPINKIHLFFSSRRRLGVLGFPATIKVEGKAAPSFRWIGLFVYWVLADPNPKLSESSRDGRRICRPAWISQLIGEWQHCVAKFVQCVACAIETARELGWAASNNLV